MEINEKPSRQNDEGNLTSGYHLSYWISSVKPLKFSPLTNELDVDVVIVGAGISGLTTAYLLAKSGRKVTVLEDGYVGSGETGRTTAHLVNALDDFYAELERLHGKENAKLIAESHTSAILQIEEIVNEEKISCDFRRLNGYLFLHPTDDIQTLEEELQATQRAGIKTRLVQEVPGMQHQPGPSLEYPNQAQFHPMKYLHGLSQAILNKGGKIYTETRVESVKENELEANGFTVKAKHIVVATNTPINNMVTMHTKQFPYRTYVIAATVPKGKIQPALWWDTGDHESKWVTMPYNYVRVHEYNDDYDLLIHGGEDHKTGQSDEDETPQQGKYAILEGWLRARFPDVKEVVYTWSGQVLEPVDAVAFIGRNPGDKEVYIITGDSGNGMTHGTIGGMLISDLINKKTNPWEKIYDPSRINFKSAGDFFKEVGNMAKQYGDFLTAGDLPSADQIREGEGAVIRSGLKKIAVYRDEEKKLHAYSAICPHLGCVVQWNADEKSFDCPCHGSRFTADGKLVNGPAVSDLKKIDFKEK